PPGRRAALRTPPGRRRGSSRRDPTGGILAGSGADGSEARDDVAQLVELERLRDRPVGTPAHAVDLDAPAEEHDRELRLALPNLVEERETALGTHVDVEQDDRRRALRERGTRLREIRRLEHAMSLGLEIDAADQPDSRRVVDDENGVRVHGGAALLQRGGSRPTAGRRDVLAVETGGAAY